MRPVIALAVLGAALAGGTATAEPDCTYAGHNGTRVGVCTEYVCVDICAPEYHVSTQCEEDLDPAVAIVRAACVAVDRIHVVVP